ncbi:MULTISPECIES: ParB/RepB/Spo0J family partition protein [unclassified Variovorax]|uniref:ParB/RepB/Spo0J family partition protein n=1 Tax=unclassified Variovorax TaxID=663243 RepID=UPI001BD5440E|nr:MULTISPECIES: ParB/RepB/Spo0J family partition protein [unclassified Variovorax]
MGLRDKASKIDFASLLAPAGAVPSEPKGPKTAPGAMMAHANDARSELLRENEELRGRAARTTELEAELAEAVSDLRGWDGAKPVRSLDPAQVGRSRFANRHASSYLGDDFERLKREIMEAGGNVQPIKVRPGKGGEEAAYEIVFGHRRHEACRQLGLPVLAVVDNLDDRTLFVEMDRENRERAELSPWEQGVMYLKALDQGLFSSNRQLATALGIDPSNLGKSLALAKLPDDVVAAFATPLDIQLRWAPLLNKALEEDQPGLVRRAAEMEAHRGPRGPKAVLAYLVTPPNASDAAIIEPQTLMANGKKAATLRFDAVGRAALHVHRPLSAVQQSALRQMAEDFVKSL